MTAHCAHSTLREVQLRYHYTTTTIINPLLPASNGIRYSRRPRTTPRRGVARLTAEVAQDIDTLTRHVDAFATRREHQAFQAERAALQQENAAVGALGGTAGGRAGRARKAPGTRVLPLALPACAVQ